MDVEYVSFDQKKDRFRYISKRYAKYLQGKILDLGCDSAALKALAAPCEYTGVDIAGNPDIVLDLEKVERLPFQDQIFDCVICTNVLEHLDNFHYIFEELIRVAKGTIIISLPNCRLYRPQQPQYGLPLERPFERYKWFFTISDIGNFLEKKKTVQNYRIAEQHVTEAPCSRTARFYQKLRCREPKSYLDRYGHTFWAVLQKQQ